MAKILAFPTGKSEPEQQPEQQAETCNPNKGVKYVIGRDLLELAVRHDEIGREVIRSELALNDIKSMRKWAKEQGYDGVHFESLHEYQDRTGLVMLSRYRLKGEGHQLFDPEYNYPTVATTFKPKVKR